MAEPDITRIHFFDGLFLKEGEFQEEQNYHLHMRRRINYMMFQSSGVVPIDPTDLRVTPVLPLTTKRFKVTAGMAISLRPDLKEGREIILTTDSDEIDLTTLGFSGSDEVIVAIHYKQELTQKQTGVIPATETRWDEQAIITVHKASDPFPPVAPLPDGEQYIRLGQIEFSTMLVKDAALPERQTAVVRSALFGSGLTPAISVSPSSITTGGTVTLNVTSSGGFDLSSVVVADISISPAIGISAMSVSGNTLTSFNLGFTLASGAPIGSRTLTVTSGVTVSTTLTVTAGLSLVNFDGVDVPNSVTTLDINGTGFSVPLTVEFTASSGFTTPVLIPPLNVSSDKIRVPLASIPANAIDGSVRVTSNGTSITSGFDVTPPAVINSLSITVVAINGLITISGLRFVSGTEVRFPNDGIRGPLSSTPFPSTPFGESLTDTSMTVRVPPGSGSLPVTGRVRVTTAGGTVESSTDLTVNP